MDARTAVSLLGPDFTWGTGTSAYQIEGGAADDGRAPSIWDTFSHTPGRVRNGDTGDVACDSYHRYAEDIALVRGLGVDAYRFSVSWSRVQPDGRGAVNAAGLDYYERVVDGLLDAGLAPWVTLYHWDLPQALEDDGGWMVRDTALRFADYATIVAERLGDRVSHWTTLNEPWVVVTQGYQRNRFAPGAALGDAALPTLHHQLLSHGLGMAALRAALSPGAQCGITLDMNPVHPLSPADERAAVRYDGWKNRAYADPILLGRYPDDLGEIYPDATLEGYVQEGDLAAICTPIDFLGINYYCPHTVRDDQTPDQPARAIRVLEATYDLVPPQWPDTPSGLRDILIRLRDDYASAGRLPALYVTENGQPLPAPEDDITEDRARITYLDGHIGAVGEALQAGVDVRGYFVWSLLDNFEWASGYWLRFGLVHVDFENAQRRTPKQSYAWFRDLLAAR